MNKSVRFLLHIAFACGLLLLWLLPNNEYTWMQEFDPSVSADSIEDASGNAAVLAGLILAVTVLSQLGLMLTKPSGKRVLIGIALTSLALTLWLLKWGFRAA